MTETGKLDADGMKKGTNKKEQKKKKKTKIKNQTIKILEKKINKWQTSFDCLICPFLADCNIGGNTCKK